MEKAGDYCGPDFRRMFCFPVDQCEKLDLTDLPPHYIGEHVYNSSYMKRFYLDLEAVLPSFDSEKLWEKHKPSKSRHVNALNQLETKETSTIF